MIFKREKEAAGGGRLWAVDTQNPSHRPGWRLCLRVRFLGSEGPTSLLLLISSVLPPAVPPLLPWETERSDSVVQLRWSDPDPVYSDIS